MLEVQRVKEAQRQEFLRRFYGKSREVYMEEMRSLLRFSMNDVDEPSMYSGPMEVPVDLNDIPLSDSTQEALEQALNEGRGAEPGAMAGDGFDEQAPFTIDGGPQAPSDVPVETVREEAP
ncbi:MAG: hypothetical protein GWP91_23165, partial [Rhodobacterales bacterium]|nr:hypothetical protein [Rhodobacterales bacterium]